MSPELPTTIIGLIGLAIITVGGIYKLRLEQKTTNRRMRATESKINEMHEQTVNDHTLSTNMREDLDTARDNAVASRDNTEDIYNIARDIQERQMAQGRELFGMRADMTSVRVDMTGMRTDLTGVNERLHDERKRSIQADEQLWRAFITRLKLDDPPTV